MGRSKHQLAMKKPIGGEAQKDAHGLYGPLHIPSREATSLGISRQGAIGLKSGLFDALFKGIHLNCDINIISGEMSIDPVQDISLNPAASDMAQIEIAVLTMPITKLPRKRIPSQRLLGITKLPAFMHMVQAIKRPVLQLNLHLMKLPEIKAGRPAWFSRHGTGTSATE
jgi:hypothetical protein